MKETLGRGREDESLREYRKICREKESFYRENKNSIIKAIETERKNEIRLKMPGLLKSGHTVYCRNFSLSLTGRPCSSLDCAYKEKKENVVQGCTSCMKFQISSSRKLAFQVR